MNRYTLYLDESTTHNGYFHNQVFCMAGIIIDNTDNILLQAKVDNLKKIIWHDIPQPELIVLHQMEILKAIKGRHCKPEYNRFSHMSVRRTFYRTMSSIYNTKKLIVIGATVKMDDFKKYFSNGNKCDEYLVALQLILENYCHFLCLHNGIGDIIYESRNLIEDERMRCRFYQIKLMGSMYINKETMLKHLGSIIFENKAENNFGLQLADFVPNYFARRVNHYKSDKFNIDRVLRQNRYDGGINLRDRFGIKNMP